MVVGTGLATVTESVAVAVAITAVNGTEIVLAGDTTVTGHATVRHASHASHASLVEVTNHYPNVILINEDTWWGRTPDGVVLRPSRPRSTAPHQCLL